MQSIRILLNWAIAYVFCACLGAGWTQKTYASCLIGQLRMFLAPIEGLVGHKKTYASCLIGQLRMFLEPIEGLVGHKKAYASCLIGQLRMFLEPIERLVGHKKHTHAA